MADADLADDPGILNEEDLGEETQFITGLTEPVAQANLTALDASLAVVKLNAHLDNATFTIEDVAANLSDQHFGPIVSARLDKLFSNILTHWEKPEFAGLHLSHAMATELRYLQQHEAATLKSLKHAIGLY